MFKHEKLLFHPVEVERPNPQYAALFQCKGESALLQLMDTDPPNIVLTTKAPTSIDRWEPFYV